MQEASRGHGSLEQALNRYQRLTGRAVESERYDTSRPEVRRWYRAFSTPAPRTRLKPAAVEAYAVRSGKKPMARLLPRLSEWESTRAHFASHGLTVIRSDLALHERSLDGVTQLSAMAEEQRVLAYAGADVDTLQEARELDERLTGENLDQAEWAGLTGRLGVLLGYPRCCVDAFVREGASSDNAALVASAARASKRFDALLDNTVMGAFHVLSWAPCRYDCEASARWARDVMREIGRQHPGETSRAMRALACPRLYFDDRRQAIFDGEVDDGGLLTYRGVHTPIALDGRREEAALEWIFYADVVSRLLAGDSARVSVDGVQVYRGGLQVDCLDMGGATWLPFGMAVV